MRGYPKDLNQVIKGMIVLSRRLEHPIPKIFFTILKKALVLENAFPDEVKKAKCELYAYFRFNININPHRATQSEIEAFFNELYDPEHYVRNVLEKFVDIPVIKNGGYW
jgi:hypothetical protein